MIKAKPADDFDGLFYFESIYSGKFFSCVYLIRPQFPERFKQEYGAKNR
jgi:hypothetical protein